MLAAVCRRRVLRSRYYAMRTCEAEARAETSEEGEASALEAGQCFLMANGLTRERGRAPPISDLYSPYVKSCTHDFITTSLVLPHSITIDDIQLLSREARSSITWLRIHNSVDLRGEEILQR
uniref:Uncharacterized protein n=1 Tax=Oryza punctata TaxID=4537 RepID=A0A0E0KM61_ORYPU